MYDSLYMETRGGRERVLHFYITGDTHGNFDRIEEARKEVRENEILYQ